MDEGPPSIVSYITQWPKLGSHISWRETIALSCNSALSNNIFRGILPLHMEVSTQSPIANRHIKLCWIKLKVLLVLFHTVAKQLPGSYTTRARRQELLPESGTRRHTVAKLEGFHS